MGRWKRVRRGGLALGSGAVDRLVRPAVRPADGIVLTGFWRSGTSWLLQVVCDAASAKSVFEPLYPELPAVRSRAPRLCAAAEASGQAHAFMPYARERFDAYPDVLSFLERALVADVPGAWVRRARRGVGEAFRRRVAVKLVRGQLCAGALARALPCTVLHVHRDPRAVVASVLRNGWGAGWLDRLRLRALLLEPDDGRRDAFGRWTDEIERADREGAVVRLAAYWALTEWLVETVRSEEGARLRVVGYEELVSGGAEALAGALGPAYRGGAAVGLDRPSPTTPAARSSVDAAQRTEGWRRELAPEDRDAIETTVARFGLAARVPGP